MKFKSEEPALAVCNDEAKLVFYDIEVFPNLFLVNWKAEGEGKPVVRMINPSPSDIEELIYLEEKTAIKINELLFAGILIASLGAVMDVGMSIASTLQEIYSRRPDLGMWDLFKSGMNVGKDMMGTMSNTLILAFAGGSLNTLVFIFAYNYSYHQIINMYSIGIELMQGISASMGVILTVPFTSLAGAFFISGKVLKK